MGQKGTRERYRNFLGTTGKDKPMFPQEHPKKKGKGEEKSGRGMCVKRGRALQTQH